VQSRANAEDMRSETWVERPSSAGHHGIKLISSKVGGVDIDISGRAYASLLWIRYYGREVTEHLVQSTEDPALTTSRSRLTPRSR